MSEDIILAAVSAHYEATLATHGATATGVNWRDADGQQLRHRQFLRLLEGAPNASVLDFGCGYGDFLTFLRTRGYAGRYVGIDIAPTMIETACALHAGDAASAFHVGAEPSEIVDCAMASGIFNVVRGCDVGNWDNYVEATIERLAGSARLGFGFNMLSLNSDPDRRRPDLYYVDPAAILTKMTRRYGRHVALLQDYGLWEFTVLVRHDAAFSTNSTVPAER